MEFKAIFMNILSYSINCLLALEKYLQVTPLRINESSQHGVSTKFYQLITNSESSLTDYSDSDSGTINTEQMRKDLEKFEEDNNISTQQLYDIFGYNRRRNSF